MPYPSQVDTESIVAQARQMIEAEGVEQLSLGRLAGALNIKAPSLYRYFDSKTALLRAVNTDTNTRLVAAMRAAAEEAQAHPIVALALAYRAFAHANPLTYLLAFSSPEEALPDARALEESVLPLQDIMAGVSGGANSLAALRGAFALIHGFVSLELAGQFRRGGDLEEAFVQSIEAYIRGWSR